MESNTYEKIADRGVADRKVNHKPLATKITVEVVIHAALLPVIALIFQIEFTKS